MIQGYGGNVTLRAVFAGSTSQPPSAGATAWRDGGEKTCWSAVTVRGDACRFNWIKGGLHTGGATVVGGDIAATSYEQGGEAVFARRLVADCIAVIPTGKGARQSTTDQRGLLTRSLSRRRGQNR